MYGFTSYIGEGKLDVGEGPVRTWVTVVLPSYILYYGSCCYLLKCN